jgi:hypothetical protein
MANLSEKVEAELEQMELALRELPESRRIPQLSMLELAGTASLLSSYYHGAENILKQAILAAKMPLPAGAAWHRDLLQLACKQGVISEETRDRLAPLMAFRHFFTHCYGFELDPLRLQPLVLDARPVHGAFKTEVKRYARARAGKPTPKMKR